MYPPGLTGACLSNEIGISHPDQAKVLSQSISGSLSGCITKTRPAPRAGREEAEAGGGGGNPLINRGPWGSGPGQQSRTPVEGGEWSLVHGKVLVTDSSVSEILSLAHIPAGFGRETEAGTQVGSLGTSWGWGSCS